MMVFHIFDGLFWCLIISCVQQAFAASRIDIVTQSLIRFLIVACVIQLLVDSVFSLDFSLVTP